VSAAQEANLHSLTGKSLLEIGFGKHSIPRQLVTGAGGTWTGIEPTIPRSNEAGLGKGGFGHVADIPFDDETFDVVVGIQTLEHWAEPLPDPTLETGYEKGLGEIHRVLKPGGSIYFDAPVHLHGHEMFVMGDLDRIAGLFDRSMWADICFEKWRQEYNPLRRYPTPEPDLLTWSHAVTSYPREMQDEIRDNGSVWLLTVSASKP
jgi:SAM-dependent methyltransferase